MTRPLTILQLCPVLDYLEHRLRESFSVCRWFDLSEAEKSQWLSANAVHVKGVVTGGHLGCSTDLMDALPQLGIIAINGVGFDKVDLDHARSRGIRVTNTPGVLTDDVADLAVGLIIGLLRKLPLADHHVRGGYWAKGDLPLGRKVTGSRFGIVGLGQIGSAIANRLKAFGPITYTGRSAKGVPFSFLPDIESLAAASDVLIVSSAANAENRGMIGRQVLDRLGPTGYLVNIARGSLVDEPALIEALREKRIAGAALDVFADEPNVPAELRQAENCLFTPHIASATKETREAMANAVLANLHAFTQGQQLPSPVA